MANESAGASAPAAAMTPAQTSQISESNNFGIENTPEVSVEVTPEAAPDHTKAEMNYLNKLKLKVDGQDFEEELAFELPDDPEVLAYMTKQLHMSKMAQKRAQSYSDLEKNVNSFI